MPVNHGYGEANAIELDSAEVNEFIKGKNIIITYCSFVAEDEHFKDYQFYREKTQMTFQQLFDDLFNGKLIDEHTWNNKQFKKWLIAEFNFVKPMKNYDVQTTMLIKAFFDMKIPNSGNEQTFEKDIELKLTLVMPGADFMQKLIS